MWSKGNSRPPHLAKQPVVEKLPPHPAKVSQRRSKPVWFGGGAKPGTAQAMLALQNTPPLAVEPPQGQCCYEIYRYSIYQQTEGDPARRRKLLHRLDSGEHVRREVRRKLDVGAGNLKDQVDGSDGESKARAQQVFKSSFDFTNYLRSVDGPGAYDRKPHAIAARWLGAGNCDEFAMVSYYSLLKLNIGEPISMIGCPDPGHHVALIGDWTDPFGDDAVVVDAWPSQGWAVLFKDWTYSEKAIIERMTAFSDGADLLGPVRAALRAGNLSRQKVETEFMAERRLPNRRGFVFNPGEWHMWTDTHTMTSDARRSLMAQFKRELVEVSLYGMDTGRDLT